MSEFLLFLCGLLVIFAVTRWSLRYLLLSPFGRKVFFGENQHPASIDDNAQDSYAVRYASGRNSGSLLKLVPWDASGLLSETAAGFRFTGESADGEQLDIQFPSEEATINYQKGSMLWDAGVSWCVIEVDGEKHYFTSDALSGNGKRRLDLPDPNTTLIYRNITERYIRSNNK